MSSDLRARMSWLSGVLVGIGVLAVTSRRWSAALLASALGMGLFIGVAFGPATGGWSALGSQIVALEGGDPPTDDATAQEVAPASSASSSATGGSRGGSVATDGSSSSAPISPPAETAPADTEADEPPAEEPPADGDGGGGGGGGGGDSEPDPDSFTLAGTVVQVNPLAESYALAVRGELYGIHAAKLPEPGDRLEVATRELANGTYAEDGERIADGSTEAGTLNGFVTHVGQDPEAPTYTVSARGVSVPIQVPAGGGSTELPKLGEFVSVDVDIDAPRKASAAPGRAARGRDLVGAIAGAAAGAVGLAPATPPGAPSEGCAREEPVEPVEPGAELIQRRIEPTGEEFTYFDLAGTVQALCPGSGELLVSADAIRQSGQDLTLTVPGEIDLALLEVDQPVLATAELAADGSLTLAGIASDEGIEGADDPEQLQGDFAGD